MIELKLKDIALFCGGELSGDGDTVIGNISKDSRAVSGKSLYIAIKGDRFDGNDFIKSAFDNGAVAALGEVQNTFGLPYVRVADSKKALLDIAAGYRALFDIPSVAITGSVGKTTTKEMIASVLSQKFNCLKTEGNFNNEIGMPFTALRLEFFHEIAVFEMGMSGFGEISNMTAVAKPDMAVISNIGMSHIGNLGSQENILKAKLEITEGLKQDGVLAVNGDDAFLGELEGPVKFGLSERCDVRGFNLSADDTGCEFDIEIENKIHHIRVNIPGRHNVYNALAAVTVGLRFGVEPERIAAGISSAGSVGNRMKISVFGGIKVISDCYNASPDSMRAALEVLKQENGRKVAVLADMLEMGGYAVDAHREAGEQCIGLDSVVTIGNMAEHIAETAKKNCITYSFNDNDSAKAFLKDFLKPGDSVLVKGSNGMRLFEICDFIEVNFGDV